MKILFVNSFDDPANGGGAEVTLWTLLQALTECGHECVLLSTSGQPGLNVIERNGVRIWRAGIRNIYWHGERQKRPGWMRVAWHLADTFNPLMRRHFEKVVRTEEPDIVSLHNLAGWSSSVLSAIQKFGLPTVQVLHDMYSLCAKSSMFKDGHNCPTQCFGCRVLRAPNQRMGPAVTAVVGVSRFILDAHLARGRFNDAAIKRVIMNARSPKAIEPGAIQKDGGLRIGYIGRLDPAKGVELLLDSFLSARLSESSLFIAGDGESGYVEALRDRAGGSDITFLGRVPPSQFFRMVDVVVVPSLWNEPLGMVVVEAMAHGKAVLGARRGGIPELIDHGVNGLLFDPDAGDELVWLLESLAADRPLVRRLGESAVVASNPFFDIAAWTSQYLQLYGDTMGHYDQTSFAARRAI